MIEVVYRSTLLFIVAIVAFTFKGYPNADDETQLLDINHHTISPHASLGFRILLLIVMIIGAAFLFMILMMLRKTSKARNKPVPTRPGSVGSTDTELTCES